VCVCVYMYVYVCTYLCIKGRTVAEKAVTAGSADPSRPVFTPVTHTGTNESSHLSDLFVSGFSSGFMSVTAAAQVGLGGALGSTAAARARAAAYGI
jgi:hypothetical protein